MAQVALADAAPRRVPAVADRAKRGASWNGWTAVTAPPVGPARTSGPPRHGFIPPQHVPGQARTCLGVLRPRTAATQQAQARQREQARRGRFGEGAV